MAKRALLLAIVVLCHVIAIAGVVPQLQVGSSAVNGAHIKPFSNTWTQKQLAGDQWRDLGTVTETVTAQRIDGRDVLVREQVSNIPPIDGGRTQTLVFDAETLEPIRMNVASRGKFPPAAMKTTRIDYKGTVVSGEVTSFGGESREVQQENKTPMFEAAMLGLVIAALPLEADYVAELPVNFVIQGTQWMVRASVTGTQAYTFEGKTVETWVVRTDWRDLSTGDPYPDDDSGGSFYVSPNPPQGFPYVARYVNPNVDIDVKLD